MSYPTPKELLARHGLAAKKSWGQNFLVDERVYQAIVTACALTEADTALELGAGLGTLTARLLDTGADVYAVERDRDMCALLRTELAGRPRFHLLEDNALTVDLEALPAPPQGLTAVGNLPYHIAAPLIFRLLEARTRMRRIVVMVQREVAQRMLAQVGDEDRSAMSVSVQFVAAVRRVCHAGPGSFLPPPRVQSTVVLLEPRPGPLYPVDSLARFRAVVRASFGQRRKTLRNALAAAFGAATLPGLQAAGIDAMRRGETLTLEEFARLANALPDPVGVVPGQSAAPQEVEIEVAVEADADA